VFFHGIGGARVGNPSHLREFESAVNHYRPAHLIVHFGGNDLDSNEDCVDTTIYGLISFVTLLKRQHNLRSVTIIRLLPRQRTRHVNARTYNSLVIKANTLLKELCVGAGINYWRLRGFTNCSDNIFVDGVHLNTLGMRKYYKQIRGILLKFCNGVLT
jgi:hypothetical protein